MTDRTFAPLTSSDLTIFCGLANEELRRFLERVGSPPGRYQAYQNRLLGVCLIQGAAQHFVDMQSYTHPDNQIEVSRAEIAEKGYAVTDKGRVISGVKDIDICLFSQNDPAMPIPGRRHCLKSVFATPSPKLGELKFDFIKKGLREPMALGEVAAKDVIRNYIATSSHGRDFLSKKSIIGLSPPSIFAKPLWVTHRWAEGRLPERINTAT